MPEGFAQPIKRSEVTIDEKGISQQLENGFGLPIISGEFSGVSTFGRPGGFGIERDQRT